MSGHNRNPKGKNQHGEVPGIDDADFSKKLTDLYREGLSDKKIAERMQIEGIKISESTVKRRRKLLELHGSKSEYVRTLSSQAKEQIVLNQLTS